MPRQVCTHLLAGSYNVQPVPKTRTIVTLKIVIFATGLKRLCTVHQCNDGVFRKQVDEETVMKQSCNRLVWASLETPEDLVFFLCKRLIKEFKFKSRKYL